MLLFVKKRFMDNKNDIRGGKDTRLITVMIGFGNLALQRRGVGGGNDPVPAC
jgi:hypothetical protein